VVKRQRRLARRHVVPDRERVGKTSASSHQQLRQSANSSLLAGKSNA
jgi:hypothetical protein